MLVLVDTSALYALADRDAAEHEAVRAYVTSTRDVLLILPSVLPEAAYLLTKRLGAHVSVTLVRGIVAGDFRLENLIAADIARCADLMEEYADMAIGFVDASIVAIAERLRITHILTLDRRHFRAIRPRHCATFELLP